MNRPPARRALAILIASCLSAQAQAAGAVPALHLDRIIAPQALEPLPPDEEEAIDFTGPPRSIRVELLAAQNERGEEGSTELGIAGGGFWETPEWGQFSFDATLFQQRREGIEQGPEWGGAATLWQRNFYMDGGWRLDNGIGVINTPALDMQRNQYRFFLPTVPMAGFSTQWTHEKREAVLNASIGHAGLYYGTRVVGFDIADGTVASIGGQWQWAPNWAGAASYLRTQGQIVPDERGEAALVDADTKSLHLATQWIGVRDEVQVNALASHTTEGRAQGLWLDANARRGRYRHYYGVFSLDPELAWGALPINNDVRGGYYRIAYQFARWNWSAALDEIRSISGRGFDGRYGSAFLRYQVNSTLSLGGSVNMRYTSDLSTAVQLFGDKVTDWGQTRLQLDHAKGADGAGDSWLVSVNQAFPLRLGNRFSASLAYGELSYEDRAPTATTTVAFEGGRDLTDTLSIDGTARWIDGDGPNAVRGVDFNLGINWRIHPRWTLAAGFYQSQGSQRSPFILDPLVTETPFISMPKDRSMFLMLRYERQAGRSIGVLGGAPGSAVGSITGSVFLDDNNDSVRAASEQPAANITVVLDGRYSVRTDSNGQFEFPRVAVGAHQLVVIPDNLPLPWFITDTQAQQQVKVYVREATRVDIPAGRQR